MKDIMAKNILIQCMEAINETWSKNQPLLKISCFSGSQIFSPSFIIEIGKKRNPRDILQNKPCIKSTSKRYLQKKITQKIINKNFILPSLL